ncbi:MAG: tetratricopeptide repeat protein [Candidatus Longimicrobiales bacterium M2_2A_002]
MSPELRPGLAVGPERAARGLGVRSLLSGAFFLALLLPLTGCGSGESAVTRGDRLWADSAFTEALAEYRLGVGQRGDEQALLRVAHTYAELGQLADARATYDELLTRSTDYIDQAVYDYLYLADRSMARGDEHGVALALDAALSLRPEIQLPEMFGTVARFHREAGDLEEALGYYRRALTMLPPDSMTEPLYEIGLLHEELNECGTAMDYFRAFQARARESGGRRWVTLIGEARWHTGNCAYTLAREAQRAGRAGTALAYYERMIELGEPENLLDRAWFERGEILYTAGRFDEALAAYRMVLERNPSRTGQLVERAQRRIDDIRFGPTAAADTAGPWMRADPAGP